MSALDSLLIAWWPLTAVTGALVYAYVNWIRDPTAIAWSLSVDQDRQQVLQTTLTRPVYLAIGVAVTISVVITTVGLLAFLWLAHWTRLLLLNFQLLMVLFGAVLVAHGFSSSLFLFSDRWSPSLPALLNSRFGPGVFRAVFVLFGFLAIACGLYWLIGDLAFPRLIVEGRIDRTTNYSRHGDQYVIVVDGKRYDAIREVYLARKVGERMRAELGAGSKTILQADPIHLQ
jgi:hypothetical protein